MSVSTNASSSRKRKFRLRFGIRALLMLMVLVVIVVAPWANVTHRQIRACEYFADKRIPFEMSEPLEWLRFLPKAWLAAGGGHWCCGLKSVSLAGNREARTANMLQGFKDDLINVGKLPRLHELQFDSFGPLERGGSYQELFQPLANIGDLHTIRIATSGVFDEFLVGLPALPTLRALEIQRTSYLSDIGLEQVQKFPRLETLGFDSDMVQGKCLKTIASLRHIKEISSPNAHFSPSDLECFAGHPTLEKFDTSTTMNDELLKVFSSCPALKLINGNHSLITDHGLSYISTLEHLEEVQLQQTTISDVGFASLANCPSLKKVDCENCKLTDAIGPTLQKLTSIESLNLDYTSTTGGILKFLLNKSQLTDLRLASNSLQVDDVLAFASQIPRLEWKYPSPIQDAYYRFSNVAQPVNRTASALFLSAITGLSGRIAHAQHLSKIQGVVLSGTDITDQDLRDLASNCSLTSVAIDDTAISIDGLSSLANQTNLGELQVGPFANSDEALEVISLMPSVRRFSFAGDAGLTRVGQEAITKMKKLEYLEVGDWAYDQEFAEKLCKLPKLEIVHWANKSWSEEDIEDMRLQLDRRSLGVPGGLLRRVLLNPGLQSVTIVDEAELEALKRQQIRSIDAKGVAMSSQGMAALNKVLSLGALNLDGCNITDDLLQLFDARSTLTSLDLSNNPITDAAVETLVKCKNLHSIKLANTRLTDAGISRLMHELKFQIIDLSGTAVSQHAWDGLATHAQPRMTWVGLERVAAMPAILNRLRDLGQYSLPSTSISSERSIKSQTLAVLLGLKPNNNLSELDITRELLEVWPLNELLADKTCLTDLMLTGCDDLGNILKAASQECPSLYSLRLDNEPLDAPHLSQLPPQIRSLVLTNCKLTTESLETIARRCPYLVTLNIHQSQVDGCSFHAISKMARLNALTVGRTTLSSEQHNAIEQLRPFLSDLGVSK